MARTLLPPSRLPEGVEIQMLDQGELGLFATEDFDEGTVVFQESPLGKGVAGCVKTAALTPCC